MKGKISVKLFAIFALMMAVTSIAWAQAPIIVGQDGEYLGRLSANTLDPDSVSNPLGRYGSPLSPTSINNPLGRYGSPLSPYSATNPLATQPPLIIAPAPSYGYGYDSYSTYPRLTPSTRYRSRWTSWR